MNWFRRIFHREDIAQELAEEMRVHLEEKIEAFEREGMSRDEAGQAARRAFGNTTVIAERSRETWQWPRIENIWTDAKYALRQLRNAPAFAATAILTLALGIGVNTSIFTVFQQVLLKTMPVHRAEELVLLEEHSRFETGTLNAYAGSQKQYFSYPAYEAMRSNRVTSDMAVSALSPVVLTTHKLTERADMQFVSGNYFDVLALQPLLGRLLTPADNRLHAGNPVAVVSEAYWRAHLGADASLLNQTILLNNAPVTLIGIVCHQGLMDGRPVAFFVPVAIRQLISPGHGDPMSDPLNVWLNIVARLAPGVTRTQAESQLNTLWWNWRRDTLSIEKDEIGDRTGWLQTHLSVVKGSRGISIFEEDFGQPVAVLQTMAVIVLLIVCGNIANLLLARAIRRHSELAMRAALGASRQRIFQQVIIEGLILGLIGAACGLPLGLLTLRLLLQATPETDVLHLALASHIDWRIVAFSIAAGILTSVLFSIGPAVLSTRIDLQQSLHGRSGAATAGSSNLRSVLVVAQIALSLGLMASATIFACNLYRLRNIKPGFATSHVLTFFVDAMEQGRSAAVAKQEYEDIVAGVKRLPGVTSVVYAQRGLISGNEGGSNVSVTGHVNIPQDPFPDANAIGPGFFSAMEVPLLAGREFTEADAVPDHKAVIVDEAFVRYFFGGDIQRALRGSVGFGSHKPDIPIVGVIPTIHATNLAKDPWTPFVYIPWTVSPDLGTHTRELPLNFYVRTTGDPKELTNSVRALIHSIDSSLPIDEPETMQEHIGDLLFSQKLITMLSAAMGSLALLLAAIGLYGVLAFSVTQRTREIGIRMALGADRRSVSALVCRQVATLVAAGSVIGSLIAWAAVRTLISRDKDLANAPWWLFCITGAVMLLAIAVATMLPARRAAWIDPMKALRAE
ncbi:ADOP family duplicated permease [Silvibacterium acidisoli]|uniref:ADOP family duplicated permease n=1 Tax=Acidobacteriaceae bacterium ZG23-2 TaxID=2883246 RepID=UPI00406CD4A2